MQQHQISKQIAVVEKQNEIKAKLKRAFTKIDEDKEGSVKQAVFFQILECLDIQLSFQVKNYIIRMFDKNGKINYIQAIKVLHINQQSEQWDIRKNGNFTQEVNLTSSQPAIQEDQISLIGSIHNLQTHMKQQSQITINSDALKIVENYKGFNDKITNTQTLKQRSQSVYQSVKKPQKQQSNSNEQENKFQKLNTKSNNQSLEKNIDRFYNQSQSSVNVQSEQQLFQKVLNIIKKYDVNSQKFNRVRFEMFREDKDETNEVPSNVFKTIYKRLGIKTNINDEKDIFTLLQLNASSPNNFNLTQLNKLVEIFAKQLYKQKNEEGRIVYSQGMQTFVNNNNFTWKAKQSLNIDVFFEQVQRKLRRAFQNSHEAFRFFDISMNNQIRKEIFLFCLSYFNLEFTLNDCLLLFQKVDSKQDDYIDESEFSTLYGDAKVTDYMMLSSQVQQMMRDKDSDFRQTNNFAKIPLHNDEIMDYPYFFKMKKHNLQLNQHKLNSFKSTRTRRTLSIASNTPSKNSQFTTTTPVLSKTPQSFMQMNQQRLQMNRSELHDNKRQLINQSGDGFYSTRKAQLKDGVINELIQNHYMNQYVQQRRDEDRESYLNDRLRNCKPVFKNFLDNNANILRREKQLQKMRQFKEKEQLEEDIQYNLKQTADNFQHRTFDPEDLLKNRPLKSVQRLINNYHPNASSSSFSQHNGTQSVKNKVINLNESQNDIQSGSIALKRERNVSVINPNELFKAKDKRGQIQVRTSMSKTRSTMSNFSNKLNIQNDDL